MEILLIVVFICVIGWLVLKFARRAHDTAESVLGEAWRTVLSDPNYSKRRPLEERKFMAEKEAERLAEVAREKFD